MNFLRRVRLDVLALTLSVLALAISLGGEAMVTQASQLMERYARVEIVGTSTTRPALDVDDQATGGNIVMVKANKTPRVWISASGILYSAGAIVAPAVHTQTPTPTSTPTFTPTPTHTPTRTSTPTATP
jgi:hypothetical protein